MTNEIVWMNRQAMIKRGKRMLYANWRNRAELEDMARWFDRTYGRYCSFHSGKNVKDNRIAIEKRFWHDVITECEHECGIGEE